MTRDQLHNPLTGLRPTDATVAVPIAVRTDAALSEGWRGFSYYFFS